MRYRVTWEMVDPWRLVAYCDRDPVIYADAQQTVPNDEIPDDAWHGAYNETDMPWDQYSTLLRWEADGVNFVRNVTIEAMVPQWATL